MKAVYYEDYGPADVLKYGEIEQENLANINDDQLLIKVHAAGINPVDWKIRQGAMKESMEDPFPIIPGKDVAGEVLKTGKAAKDFKPGDRIFAMSDEPTGGGYAEYAVISADVAVTMPSGLDFTEAAAVPLAALTALQALRDKGKLIKDERVLINGASGGVGSFAVQIAKALGAGEITGVCSEEHRQLVKDLGADRVIDYQQEDFTKNNIQYDLIFDAVGKSSFTDCKESLRENGRFVTTVPNPKDKDTEASAGKRMETVKVKPSKDDLGFLKGLIEATQMLPVIDKTYPLNEAQNAHRYSETGHAAGKIVLVID